MSIASEVERLESAKSDLKSALESKGVAVPEGAKLDAFPALVQQLGNGDMLKSVYDPEGENKNIFKTINAVAAKYTGKFTLDGWVTSTSEEQANGYTLAQEVTLTAVTPGAPTVMAASEFLTGCGYDPTGVAETDEILDEVLAVINAGITSSLDGGKVRTIVKEKPSAEIVVNWVIRTEVS